MAHARPATDRDGGAAVAKTASHPRSPDFRRDAATHFPVTDPASINEMQNTTAQIVLLQTRETTKQGAKGIKGQASP
ncbi:hypothetical protein ANPL_04485 [Anaplasma platys]|uniref:Uncharacterized protein n=1 Tax=Anaplasma platys TaxID=949 RepID=A0A858PZE5_9RICK|nr:hypothetical protein [Anaplasma platys]QJC27940.1 hypothetical protein ANPL_04485 [Anaplasma platys]